MVHCCPSKAILQCIYVMQENKRRIFLKPRTNKISPRSRTSSEGIWNEMEPTHLTEYVASSPRSMVIYPSCSWILLNSDLLNVICLDAPLSTYQPTLDTMLVDKQESMEKEVSNKEVISSTLVTIPTAAYFMSFPFFNGHYPAWCPISWHWNHMTLLRSFFPICPILHLESFPATILHLSKKINGIYFPMLFWTWLRSDFLLRKSDPRLWEIWKFLPSTNTINKRCPGRRNSIKGNGYYLLILYLSSMASN